jgi:hypothetical protein
MGPLLSFGRDPGWRTWVDAYLNRMIDTIDQGEWYGYYTYGTRAGRRIDAPMRITRFLVESNLPEPGRICLQTVGGKDGVGPFEFRGHLCPKTMRVMLTKSYGNQLTWNYTGALTPLGIAGCWGPLFRPHVSGGLFWLWKRDWMNPGILNGEGPTA